MSFFHKDQELVDYGSAKQSPPSPLWAQGVNLNFKEAISYYQHAYQLANDHQDFTQAALVLMQVNEQKVIDFSNCSPLTYDSLLSVIRANPACAKHLLRDLRNILLLDTIDKLTSFLKSAPNFYESLFEHNSIFDLVKGPVTLGAVLEACPGSFEYLVYKRLLFQVIKFESNMLDLAHKVPELMPQILDIPAAFPLLKKPDNIVKLFLASPQSITYLKNPRIQQLLPDYCYPHLINGLKVRANQQIVAAQKALGMAYWEGYPGFKGDKVVALQYFKMAAKKDEYCANKVGEFYFAQLESLIKNNDWQFDNLWKIKEEIPLNSKFYREGLILIGHTIYVSIPNEKKKQQYFRAALPYLIAAYEIQRDTFVTTLLDQILNVLYCGSKLLQGSFPDKKRFELIDKFKQEDELASESWVNRFLCCKLC